MTKTKGSKKKRAASKLAIMEKNKAAFLAGLLILLCLCTLSFIKGFNSGKGTNIWHSYYKTVIKEGYVSPENIKTYAI
jgi:hypothetical protein